MKKILVMLVLVAILCTTVFGFVGCNDEPKEPVTDGDKVNVKLGVILLHDENSGYDLNFIHAVEAVQEKLGLDDSQVVFKKNIPESDACYQAAADLADQGCNVIFADSFGHETYIIKAAKEFTDVEFCHATGVMAHTEGLANYHNAFASIYEGRYLAGVVAGLKIQEAIAAGEYTAADAKIGYVGAYHYAEVISGLTSFYLGAKSIVPEVTMDVQYTGSWFSIDGEKESANALIKKGAKVISQHADSPGAPTACEEAGIPNVGYNVSTKAECPETYLGGSKINWAPYIEYIVTRADKGEAIDADWTGTTATGSVETLELGNNVAEGTEAKLTEVKAKLASGELNVFDTANFTVAGAKLTSYMADIDFDADFTADTEVIENGILFESKFRSAPYFALEIDGINFLNRMF